MNHTHTEVKPLYIYQQCSNCSGYGTKGFKKFTCPSCEGKGVLKVEAQPVKKNEDINLSGGTNDE